MIRIEIFVNELMSSNCYIVWDDVKKHTVVVDPASEFSLREISFIENNFLNLDYIILTHEHTDHTWGVNSLLDAFPEAKVVATLNCKNELPKADQSYFRLYMDDANYEYYVRRVDVTTEELNWVLDWQGYTIHFISTPGHSIGSMCFSIEANLFTGDTIMQFKKMFINRKTGSWDVWRQSVEKLKSLYSPDTMVIPGHGDGFKLEDFIQ